MRSQILSTNGSIEICKERMLVNQRRKQGWSR